MKHSEHTAEEWREILGTDYSVSDMGRVESRKGGKQKILRSLKACNGYSVISISANGAARQHYIHALVAEAFLGPRPTPKHEVNHKNGVRTDPRVENLEWCTRGENSKHSYSVLGQKATRGEASGRAKLTEKKILEILARASAGEPYTPIAIAYGIHRATVSRIVTRQRWGWLAAEQGRAP